MSGVFITFEGNEGSGKSTQISTLASRLRAVGYRVRTLREPGGTPIGEEIRHTLKHSGVNHAMTSEAELLLMNASRAQLVREVIRPALAAGDIVLCDRFSDSTIAYQGYGRQLDLERVRSVVDFAVGDTRPHLTLLLEIPVDVSEARREARQARLFSPPPHPDARPENVLLALDPEARDRFEEADRTFFERVERGYQAIAAAEPRRVKRVDATVNLGTVSAAIWNQVESFLAQRL